MKKIGSLLLFLFPFIAFAKVSVESSVPKTNMAKGESFVFSVVVNSESSINSDEPRLSDLKGFKLNRSWSGSQSQSTYANGNFEVLQTRSYNYELVATRNGRLEIGPAEVNVDGNVYKTQPIVLNVQGEASRNSPNPQPLSDDDPIEDLFNQMVQRHQKFFKGGNPPPTQTQPTNANELFSIEAEVDKTTAYTGEQITANWYLYTRGIIRDIDTLKYPSLSGFWKEEIELATRLNFENYVANGVMYKRALLASYALFPIKEGAVEIDPYKAKCVVLTGDAFGFSRPYQFTKGSKPMTVTVKPLPLDGKPKDFSGAVGEFQVNASVDQTNVPLNQPITLKIRFEGHGNAKLIDLPPLNLPENLELYDTKKESKFFRDGHSYKEFEVLLIPRKEGLIEIPPITVSVFNPTTATYVAQATNSFKIQVLPSTGAAPMNSIPSPLEKPVAQVPQALTPFVSLNTESEFPLWIFGLLFLGSTLFFIFKGIKEYQGRSNKDRLKKRLKLRLKTFKDLIKKSDFREVGLQATNLIYLVLGELAGQGGASREFEVLLRDGPPSVRREIGDQLRKVLSLSESLAFAPEHTVEELKSKARLQSFISELEKTLHQAVLMAEERGR